MTAGDTGLRARKKVRTRQEIQDRATELFAAQGYAATTVEQIAAAADVSPRTVYRYFPTKDVLVVTDVYDDRLLAAYRRQPRGLSAVEAFRRAFTETFGGLGGDEMRLARLRHDLVLAEPELQAAQLRSLSAMASSFIDVTLERTGRPDARDEVTALVGAVIGITLVASQMLDMPTADVADELAWVDAALTHLEHGFAV